MLRGDYTYKTVGDGVDVGATVYWEEAARSGHGRRAASSHRSVSRRLVVRLVAADTRRGQALVFHGGGFVVGTRLMITAHHVAHLAAAGFVVVSADYSLCPQVSLFNGPAAGRAGRFPLVSRHPAGALGCCRRCWRCGSRRSQDRGLGLFGRRDAGAVSG